jgi:hypothetical protein
MASLRAKVADALHLAVRPLVRGEAREIFFGGPVPEKARLLAIGSCGSGAE